MRRLAWVALWAGCFAPSFDDGKTPCTTDSNCPPSYHCAVDHTCWHDGRDPVSDMSVADMSIPADGAVDSGSDLASHDLANADLVAPPDLLTPVDLSPIFFTPASVWISNGGGSVTGPSSQSELNVSIGGNSTVGQSLGPASGRNFTFGYFCADSIP